MIRTNKYPMSVAVGAQYALGGEDEAMEPMVLVDTRDRPVGRIEAGDIVIFYDLRGEREIELTQSLTDPEFSAFPTVLDRPARFVTMIEYDRDLDVRVAYPPVGPIRDTLSETVSRAGCRQTKVAESEKAVHITYFLNGKIKDRFPGETVRTVESPNVADYTAVPELAAVQVTETVCEELADESVGLVVANLANVDVLGHIEDAGAIRRAVECVDEQVGVLLDAARRAGVAVVVTADHGTVEKWYYPDGQIDTGHTDSDVPCAVAAFDNGLTVGGTLREGGTLTDVAPTVLELLDIAQPTAMTGVSLLSWRPTGRRRVLLLILDGWGLGDGGPGDLIARADTPVTDRLWRDHPSTRLRAAGAAVGMPVSTVGNSEVGHLHIGAGRVVYSDRVRIDRAIADGSFFDNPALRWAIETAHDERSRIHLLGIVSFYSSHGSLDHLYALMDMVQRADIPEIYIHSLLGRRGERPESGAGYIEDVERRTGTTGVARVVSVMGRFWALDREQHWDRVAKAYTALVRGDGIHVPEK